MKIGMTKMRRIACCELLNAWQTARIHISSNLACLFAEGGKNVKRCPMPPQSNLFPHNTSHDNCLTGEEENNGKTARTKDKNEEEQTYDEEDDKEEGEDTSTGNISPKKKTKKIRRRIRKGFRLKSRRATLCPL